MVTSYRGSGSGSSSTIPVATIATGTSTPAVATTTNTTTSSTPEQTPSEIEPHNAVPQLSEVRRERARRISARAVLEARGEGFVGRLDARQHAPARGQTGRRRAQAPASIVAAGTPDTPATAPELKVPRAAERGRRRSHGVAADALVARGRRVEVLVHLGVGPPEGGGPPADVAEAGEEQALAAALPVVDGGVVVRVGELGAAAEEVVPGGAGAVGRAGLAPRPLAVPQERPVLARVGVVEQAPQEALAELEAPRVLPQQLVRRVQELVEHGRDLVRARHHVAGGVCRGGGGFSAALRRRVFGWRVQAAVVVRLGACVLWPAVLVEEALGAGECVLEGFACASV